MEPKDAIKEQILQAGLKLMNQFGYGSLSLSELARQSKISKQRLYYHFPSPEDVLLALAQEWSKSGQQFTVEELARTREVGAMKVIAMSKATYDWMRKDWELARLGLVLYQSSPHIKKLNEFMEGARDIARERLKSILIQDQVFAEMSKKDLEKATTAIHSMLYGFYFYVVTMNDFENLSLHESNCYEALRKLILSYK